MQMNDDFNGPMPTAPSKSKVDYKKIAKDNPAAAFDLILFGWHCLRQRTVSTLVIGLGAISLVTATPSFLAGLFGFAVSNNAHPTQAVSNGLGLYIVRPVLGGVSSTVLEASFREQNQLANPNGGGTLTATQVRALQGMRGTQVQYVTNRQRKQAER